MQYIASCWGGQGRVSWRMSVSDLRTTWGASPTWAWLPSPYWACTDTATMIARTSPQILRLDDDQRHMRGAARPIDMTFSGPVTCQADIACMENLDGAGTAAAFELELAGQEDRQVVDDLRMPVDESILPAHEAEAGRDAGRAPLIRRSREQLRKFGKIRTVILALIQVLVVGP